MPASDHRSLSDKIKRLATDPRLDQAKRQLKESIDQGLDRHVRLAVTGLSQSGKTVFISALIHQLLHCREGKALPFFTPSSEQRLLGVRQIQCGHSEEPAFPYQQAIARLSGQPPQWPASTESLSTTRLAIRYRPKSRLRKLFGDTATLTLDIIDYPGEWLLDLPLLQLSYSDWCRQCRSLFASGPRARLAEDWLVELALLDLTAPADEGLIQRLSATYRKLLLTFRNADDALSLLQPGRFVLPAELAGSPLLNFFPLPQLGQRNQDGDIPDGDPQAPAGSYLDLLSKRFETYKSEVVDRFYREHFSRFDRQVVLVDCLKTLNRGQHCFEDMQRALTQILHSFNYGRSSLLRRLFKPRIDKVLFACTKADHVTANQHHNLERFLELIIDDAQRDIRFEGVETQSLALASLRATEAAEALVDGQRLSCLKGLRKGSQEPVALFPGEVPTHLPTQADWHAQRFQFIDFAPPKFAQTRGRASAHIRLDQALEYLLGDKFA